MSFTKIEESVLNSRGATTLPNQPTISATALKREFDAPAKEVIAPAFNQLVEELEDNSAAGNLGAVAPSGRVVASPTVQTVLNKISDDLGTLEDAAEPAILQAHSHPNKDLLDSYDQDNADISDAVAQKHSHPNKAVLDGLTDNSGSLEYKGNSVGDSFKTITASGVSLVASGSDTLGLRAGANVSLAVNPTTKEITIASTGGGGGGGGDMYEADYDNLGNVKAIGGIDAYVADEISKVGLPNLSDVTITSPQVGQIIKYDGTDWVNGTAPSGGMLPYLYIDSEAGATVTVNQPDGTTITPTAAGSGHWECELTGGYGTYVIHSVLSGQGDATQSLAVDTVKEYHVTDTHYDYTINVTAPSGSSVRITGGGETYTGTGTGTSQAFAVHTASTTYTVAVTMDGNTKSETITSAAISGQSGSVTIAFGTINVSVAADFVTAGSTITCAKTGVNTISKAAASTLTFRVPETGEYTISGTLSGTPYSTTATVTDLNAPESVSLQTTINVNVTMYGAAGAVITYTDANGSQTQTLDSTGEKTNVAISVMPSSPTIVFTDTTVAKDPDNLANNYTKSVTITDGMTDVYVMPNNALYWYGWMSSDVEEISTANGWSSARGIEDPVYNTNNAVLNSSGGSATSGISTKTMGYTNVTAKAIASSDALYVNTGLYIGRMNAKQFTDVGTYTIESQGQSVTNTMQLITLNCTSTDGYLLTWCGFNRKGTLYAFWYE